MTLQIFFFFLSQKSHVGNQTGGNIQHRCTVTVLDKNIHVQVSAVAKTAKTAKRMAAHRALIRIQEAQEENTI